MTHYIVNYQEPAYDHPTNHMLVDGTGKIILSSCKGLDNLIDRMVPDRVRNVGREISAIDLNNIRGRYIGGKFINAVRLD